MASEPEALIAWFGSLGLRLERIGLEAGPLLRSGFMRRCGRWGLRVELLETRHVKAALSAMPVKTDRNDARGIAQLMRLGWFRPVHCKSAEAQEIRALLLTRRHKRRRPRRARPSRDTIKDRTSIHDRPKDIEARADIGHWEGDLVICKRTRPMLVLHERKSRVTLAARLTGKTAAETISVMLAVFGRINPALRKSITFDNDTAFAQHTLLRTRSRDGVCAVKRADR